MAEEKTIYSLYENHPEWTKTGGLFGGTGENHTGLEAFALYLYKKKVENGGSLPIDERIINPTGFIAFLKDSENPAYLSIAEKVEHMIQSNSMTKENFLDFATAIDPLNLLENGKLVVDRYESYLHQLSPVLGGTSEGASAARTKQKQDQAGQAGVGQASKPDIEIENREDSSSSLEIGSSYRTPEKGSEIAEISKKASAEKKALAYKNAPTQTGKKPEQQEELGQEDQEDNENRGQHQDRPATSGYSRVEIANNGETPDLSLPGEHRGYKRLTEVATPASHREAIEKARTLKGTGKAIKSPSNKKTGTRRVKEMPSSIKGKGHRLGEVPRQRSSNKTAAKAEEDRIRDEQIAQQDDQQIPMIPFSDESMNQRSKLPGKKKGRKKKLAFFLGLGAAATTGGVASAKVPIAVMSFINILF